MRPGEIYLAHLAQFPFGDFPGHEAPADIAADRRSRLRPGGSGAYISTIVPAQLLASDVVLDPGKPEFQSTHLKTVSVLRLHKLATIHCSSVARYLGHVDASTSATVAHKLRVPLAL